MIRQSLNFIFNGQKSTDFGIFNVSSPNNGAGGLFSEPFLSNRTILQQKIRGNPIPYFQDVSYDPPKIPLTFAFQDTWDTDLIRKVARWLKTDYYAPLQFEDNLDRIFYCMVVDEPNILHNGLQQGYIELNMQCKDPFTYSPTYTDPYDLTNNPTNGTNISFPNNGDQQLYPEIFINKIGSGDITITYGTTIFKFVNLSDGETVYVDNWNEVIQSSLPGVYRYANFNDNYLSLDVGANTINVMGNCTLQFRYQYRTLQG